jgi:phosphoribosylamine--glycine ligase
VKALVVGTGGREHAIASSLAESALVDRLFWTPGNAATDEIADNPGIPIGDFQGLLAFARKERMGLAVIGPEAPLVDGLADLFGEHGLPVLGPGADGARIEGSKVFAKNLMARAGIPTAGHAEFTSKGEALSYINTRPPPYVIKADGLAAGKGVSIVQTEREAEEVLGDFFDKKIFGESGLRVVVEDFLSGEEATVLALCDGENVLPLLSSQDHKPVFDGDRGPNTGGMGAIAPAPVVGERVMGRVMERVLLPLVAELKKVGIVYRGVIYAGLMVNGGQPSVVEFNCRLGDPEAEAVLPLLASDLGEVLLRTVKGELKGCALRWREAYACDVVIASGGYPGSYEKGKEILGLKPEPHSGERRERVPVGPRGEKNLVVFHAGTKKVRGRTVTDGGRVLNVVGIGESLEDAVSRAYRHIPSISFQDMFYRKDIGHRGLGRLAADRPQDG